MLQKKSAGMVIFHRGPNSKIEYLLLKHTERYWNFPKGTIEKGESEIMAALRETFEETGLSHLKIIPGFREYERYILKAPNNFYKKEERGKTFFKTVVFYLAESEIKDVKISFEHKGFEWLSYENVLKKFGKRPYSSSQALIKKANRHIAKMEGHLLKNSDVIIKKH